MVTAFDVLGWMIAHPWAGIPLAILGWGLFILAKPYAKCRWCKNRKQCRFKRRGCLIHRRRCWRCKNTRLARRLGAYHVHKIKLSLVQAWAERGADDEL